jgi:flagellar motility protein MotE (MotC chaperone)
LQNQKQEEIIAQNERMEQLRTEIKEALKDWENANRFFDYAVGEDQVDYAIYAIISAEKRYAMLLRTAKEMKCSWPAWRGVPE